ncbi:MAG: hypothetical protein IH830_06000 [Planctomycetes bacterium]|nr:hypothetical protein [Planctomycetota bacterium]
MHGLQGPLRHLAPPPDLAGPGRLVQLRAQYLDDEEWIGQGVGDHPRQRRLARAAVVAAGAVDEERATIEALPIDDTASCGYRLVLADQIGPRLRTVMLIQCVCYD